MSEKRSRHPARWLASAALAAGSFVMPPGDAHAAAGSITPSVIVPTKLVSYADGGDLKTYVGYRVSVANSGGNTVNEIVFSGQVTRPRGGPQPTFEPPANAACTLDATATEVTCRLGQLAGGAAVPTFDLFVAAPVQGTIDSSTACAVDQDCVQFSGTVAYAEGADPTKSKSRNNSRVAWSADDVLLGTPTTSDVRSVIPKRGNTLFTGAAGNVSPSDVFATRVVVPAAAVDTTASVLESPAAGECNFLRVCYESTITIQDFAGNTQRFTSALQITLLVHADNVKIGARAIKQILVTYDGVPVGECASGPVPNDNGVPCIAERGTDAAGNFFWKLLNLVNGSYKVL